MKNSFMQLYSTNNINHKVDLKTAVMQSLAPDRGLYMPCEIPSLPTGFLDSVEKTTIADIGFEVCKSLFGETIPHNELRSIIDQAINFEAPIHMLNDQVGSLELWHGPSLAFKDFGARFMAGLMSYFTVKEDKELTILVATSGDTGGAVAFGFYDIPGIEVIILYPKGKVSMLQEKQLTTLGKNITALEIEGSFDDCQDMVKTAFLDSDLNTKYHLSSANSINIARLIPQSFYYINAYRQVKELAKEVVFAVPSGNFGNLTAGLLAKKMGLPVKHFIAATNVNKVVPDYLNTGEYHTMKSLATISNAMDVGNPSNFVRMLTLYNQSYEAMTKDISGDFATDEETKLEMKYIYDMYQYIADPHGAIGHKALRKYMNDSSNDGTIGLFLETAHPAKFLDTVESTLGVNIEVPDRIAILSEREKMAQLIPNNYEAFKLYLMNR